MSFSKFIRTDGFNLWDFCFPKSKRSRDNSDVDNDSINKEKKTRRREYRQSFKQSIWYKAFERM